MTTLRGLGLDSAEINSGGFLPAPHLPIDAIRGSKDARDEYLAQFDAAGVALTALNCNGNPLHPDPDVRRKHGQDVVDAIELAALLGVKRVVTMSGLPEAHAGAYGAVLDGAALGQRVPRRPRLPVERGRRSRTGRTSRPGPPTPT